MNEVYALAIDVCAAIAKYYTVAFERGKYGRERFNKDFGENGQALYSYRLRCEFPTDAGALEYLRGKEFQVECVDFAEKYFGVTELDFE